MEKRPELLRSLKPLPVWALALGCIIGLGCFVLPGDFLARAGPAGAAVSTSPGNVGLACLALGVCMGVFTGINGFFMACGRLLFSMSRARILPAWFSHVHPTHGTPTRAILFTGAVSRVAPWFARQVIL